MLLNCGVGQDSWDSKEIKLVNPKGYQSWIFIGKTDAEVETPILWPLDMKNGLIGKDLNAGQDWRKEDKGITKDEMVGWHHWLDGHKFDQAPGVGDGQGSLMCCSPWGHKELDTTEWLSWTELSFLQFHYYQKPFKWDNFCKLSVFFPQSLQRWLCLIQSTYTTQK